MSASEQHEFSPEAVEHALAARDFEAAARLLELGAGLLSQQREPGMWLKWMQALPEDAVRSRPRLGIKYARVLSQTVIDLDTQERLLQEAETALGQAEPGADVQHLRGSIAALRVSIAAFRGDVLQAEKQLHQALELLPKEDFDQRFGASTRVGLAHMIRGDALSAERIYLEFDKQIDLAKFAGASWGLIQMRRGRLARAERILRTVFDLDKEIPLHHINAATPYFFWEVGEICYERNQLDIALSYLLQSTLLYQQWNNTPSLADSYYGLARLYLAQGQRQQAEEVIQQLEELASKPAPTSSHRLIGGSIGALHAHVDLLRGNLAAASRWVQASGLTVEDQLDYDHLLDHLVLARLRFAQERPGEALRLLLRLLQQAETDGRVGDVIQILALQALALQASGDMPQALQALTRALALAEPEGYVRTFVDEGQPMAGLLQQVSKLEDARPTGYTREYVQRLLAAFGAA